jgi:20S proteasome alpha/beta subunit
MSIENASLTHLKCFCVAATRRVLVKAARKLAQQYILTYSDEIPTAQLVQRVANVMQEYTQSGYAA